MEDALKRELLEKLRGDFIEFMEKVLRLPGSPIQKQQALFRFDEGHMWLQNAIMSMEAKPVELPNQQVEEVINADIVELENAAAENPDAPAVG